MIVRGESTIIDYHAPFDLSFILKSLHAVAADKNYIFNKHTQNPFLEKYWTD